MNAKRNVFLRHYFVYLQKKNYVRASIGMAIFIFYICATLGKMETQLLKGRRPMKEGEKKIRKKRNNV